MSRQRWWSVGLLVLMSCALAPSMAVADGCPSADQSYTGNCGPMFAVPTWTDAGGWNDPSQYSTIRLADLNGDGTDELIGRSDAGVEIFWFDTTLGQWRPQVDADAVPQLLSDFASFLPSDEGDPHNPNQPQFYSTILAADVDGQPGAEILGRFWDGMRVYKYNAPASNKIDGGTWSRIGTAGPFSDADGYNDPSLYSTIGVAQFEQGHPSLFARKHSGATDPTMAFYDWNANGTWSEHQWPASDSITSEFSDQDCAEPSCYLSIQAAQFAAADQLSASDDSAQLMGRDSNGVDLWDLTKSGGWAPLQTAYELYEGQPFNDTTGLDLDPDCPFAAEGARGPGSGDCLGSSPSYYETLQAADIDGKPGDEVFARASDGLRLVTINGDGVNTRATLPALAGGPSDAPPGMWGSIRAGNIDGQGGDEVLFLDPKGNGLQAWTYDPTADAWNQLQPSTPLTLGSDPWLSNPEYYSTIHTGDVDGDGHDDVIARGPYGIRTWFYNRRGTGGWERYLPEGYPDFTGDQAIAFGDLNTLLRNAGVILPAQTVRDVWASENPPAATDLARAHDGLVAIGNCSGASATDPPSYQACTPPGTNTPEWAAAWTAVINQLLAENYYAGEALDFFDELKDVNEDLFLAENAELPGIGDVLAAPFAAGTTTQFNAQQMMAGIFGIAASVAGAFPGAGLASAALWVGSEVASILPASSPTAVSTFPSTYAQLKDKFAQMLDEAQTNLPVHSQEVRQDAGLLGLVGQLRSNQVWKLDEIGIESAANQGFVTWVYKALMPTIWNRYQISGCRDGYTNRPGPTYVLNCSSAPTAPGVVTYDSQTFVAIAEGLTPEVYPCWRATWGGTFQCTYDRVPDSVLGNRIWGPMTTECSYVPGQSATAWKFGCSAGVDVRTSVANNTWGFPNHAGNPDPREAWRDCTVAAACAAATASSAQAPPQAPIRLGRPRSGGRRAVSGGAQLQTHIGTLGGMRLAGATITLNRLLFEPGHGELTHPTRAQRPLKLKLKQAGAGRFTAATTGSRPVRVTVRRDSNGRFSLTLISARVHHTPHACHALPASVALESQPLWLQTDLVISDRHMRRRVTLSHHVRCRRDASGTVNRLEYVRFRARPGRAGLAVTLRGPRQLQAGSTVTYTATVRNRRRHGNDRMVSSLWNVTLAGGTHRTRIRELRAGRARRVTIAVRVPGDARGSFCADAIANASGARGTRARACSRVQGAAPARFTG